MTSTSDEPMPTHDAQQALDDRNAADLEQGYRGQRHDPTPDENYSVAGQVAGLPVPSIHPNSQP